MKTILEVKQLCKSYPVSQSEHQTILRGVDLSVGEGEFVAVMGPSGSGKSTLLYSVSGMDRPTGGTVTMMGRELCGLPEKELAAMRLHSIGYIFQQSNLLKNLTVFDNIVLPAYRAKKESRHALKRRAEKLMQSMGIAELAMKDISQASGGQLQRASICRALINEPSIVFGDEPTGALNSGAADEVMTILEKIHTEGTTVLLVTHDVRVAARAQRVLYMRDGRIVNEISLDVAVPRREGRQRREMCLQEWLNVQGF